MSALEQLQACIDELEIIDTHEHLPPRECDRPAQNDVLAEYLSHYFSCDLVSAGLTTKQLEFVRNPSGDLMERWKLAEPYWNVARNTGYVRSLDMAAKGLYGIERIDATTIGELDEAFRAAREKGNHYRYVLKEKSRIALSIVDSFPDCDRDFFRCSIRLENFICPTHRRGLVEMGERFGVRVHTLEDWCQTLRLCLEDCLHRGDIALKIGLAYRRSLRFDKVSHADAERAFVELFADVNSPYGRADIKVAKPLQDYMMHRLLALADERGLTVQVHTGIQEGYGNILYDSNPVLLSNLFLEYENVRFDVFHMGYPYVMELGTVAKNFRNVFIDMCWGHIVSPEAARRALIEWLDAVPANKISALGGDYLFVDGVYGHQLLARRDVAAALAQKVTDRSFSLDRAKEIARMLFVDNPKALFGLQ